MTPTEEYVNGRLYLDVDDQGEVAKRLLKYLYYR